VRQVGHLPELQILIVVFDCVYRYFQANMTIHLHLVPRLRMSGVIPLLRLHALVTWGR
jgi:hypothetical protein